MESTQKKINKVELRNLQIEDYAQLAQSFTRVYADKDVFWTHEQIEKLISIFPEGQIVTVVDDKIVGCALSIIVDYDMVKGDHTYAKVTGNETFNTHNPKGNILYGIEVFIHPEYRGLRLARRMYEYRKELCEKLNLKAIMFGGRIPNYYKYADQMRPKEYIEKVRSREIYDPVLTFQLSNDFHVRRVMRNYLPNDEESKHCATLLQWDNIYYQPPTDSFVDKKTTVRVGLVQWQMRSYQTLDDVFEQVEFFIDAVSGYKSDFVLFPEYFNAPLMAKFNHMGEAQSIRALAQYTEEIRDRFINLAIKHNINIITGSMPYVKEDGGLYNVGFLCRRDGLTAQHIFQNLLLLPLVVIGDCGQQMIAVPLRLVHERVDIAAPFPFGKSAHDEADGSGLPGAEGAGDGIGPVVQFLHRGIDFLTRLPGNPRRLRVIQIKGDQLRGHSHPRCNVFQSRFHGRLFYMF